MLLTGVHSVADVYCTGCGTMLGWKYERAFEPSQRYKEGKVIIELAYLIKDNCWDTKWFASPSSSSSPCSSSSSPSVAAAVVSPTSPRVFEFAAVKSDVRGSLCQTPSASCLTAPAVMAAFHLEDSGQNPFDSLGSTNCFVTPNNSPTTGAGASVPEGSGSIACDPPSLDESVVQQVGDVFINCNSPRAHQVTVIECK